MFETKVVQKSTHFMFYSPPRKSCHSRVRVEKYYSTKPDRPQMTIWRMRIAFWVTKTTNRHSEYVIPIAFPLQQLLYERASLLRLIYFSCFVYLLYICAVNCNRFCWVAVFTLTDVIILEALNFICLREVKFRNNVNALTLLTSLFLSLPGKR